MGITITHDLDEIQITQLIDDGYTTLKLYKSDTPDGNFTDSGVTPSPSTLAAAVTAEEPFTFTFSYSGGNPSQWFKIVAYDGVVTSSLLDSEAFSGGGGTTLTTMRQRLGRLMNVMLISTTTSAGNGGGTTAIANRALFARYRDDYFGGVTDSEGWYFHNVDTSEWTLISDWVQSTRTFTLSPALSAQVGSGANIEVMARWTPDDYRSAINWAIVNTFPTLCKIVTDTSILTEEDIFSYQVPNNIKVINKVEIETDINMDSTDGRTRGMPWREIPFTEIDEGLTRKLEFKRELDDGRRLRVTGTAMLSQLYNDDDYTEAIDPQVDLILYLAAHRLYAELANNSPSTDIDRYRDQANYYMAIYNENKGRRATRKRTKRFWSHDQIWNNY